MSFRAHIKKYQSIEDGTISVLLKVPADQISAIISLFQQDVDVVPIQAEIPEDKVDILRDIRMQLQSISARLVSYDYGES